MGEHGEGGALDGGCEVGVGVGSEGGGCGVPAFEVGGTAWAVG